MQTRQLRRAAERNTAKQARKQQNQGKAVTTQSSFKYGLYSKHTVVRNEDPAELDSLKADLRTEHQPANTTEEILVNEMAEQFWRIRRFRDQEVCYTLIEDPEQRAVAFERLLPMIQRMMSTAERGFHKALTSLRQLQKDRGFVPHFSEDTQHKEEIAVGAAPGFVPQSAPPKPLNLDNDADFLSWSVSRRPYSPASTRTSTRTSTPSKPMQADGGQNHDRHDRTTAVRTDDANVVPCHVCT